MRLLKRIYIGSSSVVILIVLFSILINRFDIANSKWYIMGFSLLLFILFVANIVLYIYVPLHKTIHSLKDTESKDLNNLANKNGIVGELAGLLQNYINHEVKDLQLRSNFMQSDLGYIRMLINKSKLHIAEWDFEKGLFSVDKRWQFLFSAKPEVLKKQVFSNISPNHIHEFVNRYLPVVNNEQNYLNIECKVLDPIKGDVWIALNLLVIERDKTNKPLKMIGFIRDISNRVLQVQNLHKQKTDAEESDQLKTYYLHNMSYEIRTPMNAIFGFSQLMADKSIPADEKEIYADIIRKDTDVLLKIVDEIINYAKVESDRIEINKKEFHVNEFLRKLLNETSQYEFKNDVRLVVKTILPDDTDIINCDENALKQVVTLLISNAYKFTNEGYIEVGYFVRPDESKIIFYVKDTGIGIEDIHLPKIFNRFYQINAMTEGIGLGLSISKNIVENLSGTIYVESDFGEGSSFFIELQME